MAQAGGVAHTVGSVENFPTRGDEMLDQENLGSPFGGHWSLFPFPLWDCPLTSLGGGAITGAGGGARRHGERPPNTPRRGPT